MTTMQEIHGETVAPVYERESIGLAMLVKDGVYQFAAIDPIVSIIFSADFMRYGRHTMNFMDPTHDQGGTGTAFPEFYVTEEDDEGNEFDYLANDIDKQDCFCDGGAGRDDGFKWTGIGYTDIGSGVKLYPGELYRFEMFGHVVQAEPCDYCGGSGNYADRFKGPHRKWCGDLTWDRWLQFADRYCIELDDNGMPERYDETMGSLTMAGLLPAVRVDNTEGWSSGYDDGGVIDSSFYITFLRWHIL